MTLRLERLEARDCPSIAADPLVTELGLRVAETDGSAPYLVRVSAPADTVWAACMSRYYQNVTPALGADLARKAPASGLSAPLAPGQEAWPEQLKPADPAFLAEFPWMANAAPVAPGTSWDALVSATVYGYRG